MSDLFTIKSYFAPRADRFASSQLSFLILNAPFVVLLNNYKSNFVDLANLRQLVMSNNGFSYHPNKNVKARAFKGFSKVLSPDFLGGLVVFAFFRSYKDLISFMKSIESLTISNKLGYFAILVDGHITSKRALTSDFFLKSSNFNSVKTVFSFNKKFITEPVSIFQHTINRVLLTLDAYIKSAN